jgi:DNA-binding NtrC family response regulator
MVAGRQLKLLVIDDERGIVDFTKKIFRRKGFLTFGATDGIRAMEIFNKEHTDINLIDIHMPYSPIDGVEILKRIKETDKDAICIMISRILDRDKVEASKRLGALHYITKPLGVEELDKAVAAAKESLLERNSYGKSVTQ